VTKYGVDGHVKWFLKAPSPFFIRNPGQLMTPFW
jgi:hypothetical protein